LQGIVAQFAEMLGDLGVFWIEFLGASEGSTGGCRVSAQPAFGCGLNQRRRRMTAGQIGRQCVVGIGGVERGCLRKARIAASNSSFSKSLLASRKSLAARCRSLPVGALGCWPEMGACEALWPAGALCAGIGWPGAWACAALAVSASSSPAEATKKSRILGEFREKHTSGLKAPMVLRGQCLG